MCHNSDGYSVSSSEYYRCVDNHDHLACEAVCNNWCRNSWYLESEGVQACEIYLYGPPKSDFERMLEDIGREVTNALEGLNVDVDGISRWVEDKARELEDMEDRHQREVEEFGEKAA